MSPRIPEDNDPSSPDFSDVQGHVDTVPGANRSPGFADVQSHSDTVPASGGDTYTVKHGDTLSQISQHHYGRASHWHAIFDANRDQLDDPDRIRPGQVLRLPALDG
ncbi:MAG: LysM peptidoglycan-binding protein [Xanthomonadaceae bacterium]|nr:LysM peptidoglycan-binding protein [Xanthomonadaceae bacterium]